MALKLFWGSSRHAGMALSRVIPDPTEQHRSVHISLDQRNKRQSKAAQGAIGLKASSHLFRDKTSTDSSEAGLSIFKIPSSSDTLAAVTIGYGKFTYSQSNFHILSIWPVH